MRPLVFVLILLATAPSNGQSVLQEDRRVPELLAKLDDDSIEVRAAAAVALTDLGKVALPALKRLVPSAGVEMKDRLSEIIRKIQDRDRLSSLLPPPSRISIDAKDRPLREVFEKLSKQTSTPIDYSQVPEDAKVTVTLDRVPLWKALDRVCRASGRVMPELENDHVVITPEPYVELPGRITDLFCVTLQRLELSTEVVFGSPDRYDRFNATFHVGWEKGARPYHVTAHIAELVDEAGNELVAAGEDAESVLMSSIAPDMIRQDFALDSPHGPGPQALKISKLKVEIEFEFPLKYAEVKLDVSTGKVPAAATCAEFDVRLSRLERQEGALTASLVMVPHGPLEGEISGESVVLRDKNGKEYPAIVTEGTPGNESETPYQLTFPSAPEHQEFTEIQIRIPTEVHRERLDVELKDLNLK
ncbi:MAG TPA: hypothetical protein VNM14_06400 [Planctomycetota bacterium]|nr:hypothetical protein [Planctomycetota bacterium]